MATAREYENGQLSHIVRTGSQSAEWTFGDPPEASTRIVYGDSLTTVEEDMVFEPGVVFMGHPHDPDGLLSASDSLVSLHHKRT